MSRTFDSNGYELKTETSQEDIDRITAEAQAIVEERLGEHHIATFFGVKSKGVSGDEATYENAVIITWSDPDARTKWEEGRINGTKPGEVGSYIEALADTSTALTNRIDGVNHVVLECLTF